MALTDTAVRNAKSKNKPHQRTSFGVPVRKYI